MKILTVTLNPAFDIHCCVDNLRLNKENYASDVTKDAGGKGINISRALTKFGIPNTAYCVLGKENGEEFYSSVKNDGIDCVPLMTDGKIRENFTVHSENGETRISFEGFDLDSEVLDRLYEMIKTEMSENMLVTFTGRLPRGITANDAVNFLLKIKALGALLIVDCNSFSAEELYKIKPYLIKPNEQEITQLTGKDICHESEVLCAANELCGNGIENVIVSLGSKGFVFANGNSNYAVQVPQLVSVSTIGAGDSLIAGFAAGILKRYSPEETLKLAAAFGSAACLVSGTHPPEYDSIMSLFQKVKCKKL